MNIPTANIVVAFKQEVMERLFAAGATYRSLVKELSDGDADALLFNNEGNPNFISFEHTLTGKDFKMVLKFVDPKGEFERRFLTDNPARVYKGISTSGVETTKAFVRYPGDTIKKFEQTYSKEDLSEFKRELEKSHGQREIYIAYGTGDNLNLWSGPHKVALVNATYEIKGAREISLTLAPLASHLDPTGRRGAYNEPVNLNLFGLNMRFAGESQPIDFTKPKAYDPTTFLDGNQLQSVISARRGEVQEALSDAGFSKLSSYLEKFDIHCMVVDAIRNYVQKAANTKNVIILLPDLNVVCRQALQEKALEADALKASDVAPGRLGIAASRNLGPGIGNLIFGAADTLYGATFTKTGRDHLFVRGALSLFGLRLHEADKDDSLRKKAKGFGTIGYHAEAERFPTADAAFEKYYEDRIATAVVDKTDDKIPNHVAVLTTIFNNIAAASKDSYSAASFCYGMMETDLNVLKMWGNSSSGPRWAKYYPFAGYDDFDPNSPAVIIGDRALIKEYLYGGSDLTRTDQEVDDLKKSAKKVKEEDTQNEGDPTAADFTLEAVTRHRLNPMDAALLTNKEYSKKIRELVIPPIQKGAGAFGDISYLPDSFSYVDESFSDKENSYIKKEGIPVFRYNTQNPNVIDMTFKDGGGVYASLLKSNYLKEITRLGSAVAEGILPTGIGDFKITDVGAGISYLRSRGFAQGMGDDNKKALITLLSNRVSPELVTNLELDTTEEAAKTIAAILLEKEEEDLAGVIQVGQNLPGNPMTIMSDLFEDLFRKMNRMEIKTLPVFHISRPAYLSSPCLLLAQDQDISQTVRPDRTLLNNFFSGLYKIVGFKHTITENELSSSFSLVKNAPDFKN